MYTTMISEEEIDYLDMLSSNSLTDETREFIETFFSLLDNMEWGKDYREPLFLLWADFCSEKNNEVHRAIDASFRKKYIEASENIVRGFLKKRISTTGCKWYSMFNLTIGVIDARRDED